MAEKDKGVKKKAQSELIKGAKLIMSMLDVYMRGSESRDGKVRAALLVERLYEVAIKADNESVRLAAAKEIMDRIDGKVAERKEIRSLKLEGVLYLPPAAECEIEGAGGVRMATE